MKNFSMLVATMVLTASICGMAKPPAVKMSPLEQLTRGEVSLWRFMLDRQLVTYGDRITEVMAKITGLDSEVMKVLSQTSAAVVLSAFDNEIELAVLESPRNAYDVYDMANIIDQKLNGSFNESKARMDIDNVLDHPEIDQMEQTYSYTLILRGRVDSIFLQYGEVPLTIVADSTRESKISTKIKPWLRKILVQIVEDGTRGLGINTEVEPRLNKILVDFLVAPSKQKLLFRAYRQGKLSESELTTGLLQLIEEDAEMGIFSTAELEELRQALQLEEYPAGIFFSKEE